MATNKQDNQIKKTKWQKLTHRVTQIFESGPLPEIFFITTFLLMRWWKNSDFQYLAELTAPLILFSLLCIAVFYGYKLLLKNYLATHSASLVLVFLLYRYQRWTDTGYGQHLVGLLPPAWRTNFGKSLWLVLFAAILAGALGWTLSCLHGKFKTFRKVPLLRFVLFIIAFVFVSALVKSGARYIGIRDELSYKYPALQLVREPGATVTYKPDIYYIVPEDYTNTEVLKRVNNFDETPFLNYLESQGFANRPVAFSNYPVTISSLASTFALNYLPEFEDMFGNNSTWQTGFPYRGIIQDPPIAQELRKNGYSYEVVSSWWDFMRYRVKADADPTKSYRLKVLGSDFYLGDLGRDIINTSVFSPWLKKGAAPVISYDLDRNPQENLQAQVTALKQIIARKSQTPKFVTAQLMIPHPPYIFKPDGSIADYDDQRNDNGADENVKYANQVAYTNKILEDVITTIRSTSPNAVIILQSDEGSYPKQFRFELTPNHYYNPIDLSVPEMRQKLGILASYYMPGFDEQTISREINSPVNAFRFVLNRYLGYKLDYLPDCHFAAGDKYSLYNYDLITDKLTGQPAPKTCKKYE